MLTPSSDELTGRAAPSRELPARASRFLRGTWAAGLPRLLVWACAVSALFADGTGFELMHRAGIPWNVAQASAFGFGVLAAALAALAVRRGAIPAAGSPAGWLALLALALGLRGGVLALLVDGLGLSPPGAWPLGFAVSSGALVVGAGLLARREESSWKPVLPWIAVAAVLLRLVYGGALGLLHEEAYYWNYAQHLDIGYYDHPPMVAWWIAATTRLLGDSLFAVRAGALACGVITAGYGYALAREVGGERRGLAALALAGVLPGFFFAGLLMTPDAPLVACWAAALFHLRRALVDERPRAWYAVGLWVGLGLLSKYTMGLLVLAVLAYVVVSPRARRWLRRPQPYVAAGIAALFFAPVVVWNARHAWASFAYQSVERVRGGYDFDLPDMLGACALLLTPVGLLTLFALPRARRALVGEERDARRTWNLLMTLTGLPLSVFVGFSLFRNIQLDWTSPLWLGVLPYLAAFVAPEPGRPLARLVTRPWPATLAATLAFLALGLHYLALGLPGAPVAAGLSELGVGVPAAARALDDEVRDTRARTGAEPMVVGLDTDRLAGWLAYYRVRLAERRGDVDARSAVAHSTGNQLLGGESGMYRYWHPADEIRGVLELVGRSEEEVDRACAALGARAIGPPRHLPAVTRGVELDGLWCQAARLPRPAAEARAVSLGGTPSVPRAAGTR